MRQIEFLDAEVDRLIADHTLRSGDARHLLTVPGVNVVCSARRHRKRPAALRSRPTTDLPAPNRPPKLVVRPLTFAPSRGAGVTHEVLVPKSERVSRT